MIGKSFNFSIPGGTTITGIKLRIKRKAAVSNTVKDINVQLIKDGSASGITNKASASYWPTSEAYADYGGSSDLWGTTWTPTQINTNGTSGFGVILSATSDGDGDASVDHFEVTVYYA